jgi:nucleotide-binding universal stress UspA family protein
MKVDRVLVPLDGSPLAEMALPIAIEALSDRPGATLILVRTAETSSLAGVDTTDAQVAAMSEAQSYLKTVADRLREAGLSRIITTCVWYSGAAHVIVEAARRRRANLIVMSRHFRSSLGRMSDGSIAESVARRAPTPVLLVAPMANARLLAKPRDIPSASSPRAVNA